MKAGDTFRLNEAADKHTWIVVSDPGQNPGKILCVAFTSFDVTKDQSCVIYPNEFSILTCISCIDYMDVKYPSVFALENWISKGLINRRSSVSAVILQRVREGFSSTQDTEFEHIQFLIDQAVI